MRWPIPIMVAVVVVVSCFSPDFRADLECGPDGECPPGTTCGLDRICRAMPGAPDAGTPDAVPVACTTSDDCLVPPNPCLQPGTCNAQNVCDFAEVDCSSMTTECTTGVCEMTTGACTAVPVREAEACGAEPTCQPFGACGGFADTCDSVGTQTQDCVRNICQAGACTAQAYQNTAACSRTTEGVACGADQVGGCGACGGFSDTCDESGTMSCTCTAFRCAGDVCTPMAAGCTQGCSRSTGGTTCGAPTVTGCAACTYGGVCSETAPDVTCTCTSFSCGGGTCNPSSTSCAQACPPRDTDGEPCGCSIQGCTSFPEPELRSKSCVNGFCANTGTCGDC